MEIAAQTKTPLLDAAGLLARQSPDGIAGNDCYVDHVHPAIGGHQKIAQAIARQAHALGFAPVTGEWPEPERRATYARHLQQLGPAYFANGRRRVEALENWARRERLDAETVPKDARGWLHLGFRRLEFADREGAAQAFTTAIQCDTTIHAQLRQHADELLAEGQVEAAQFILDWK